MLHIILLISFCHQCKGRIYFYHMDNQMYTQEYTQEYTQKHIHSCDIINLSRVNMCFILLLIGFTIFMLGTVFGYVWMMKKDEIDKVTNRWKQPFYNFVMKIKNYYRQDSEISKPTERLVVA